MSGAFTAGPWLVNPVKAIVEVPDRDAPICALLWSTDLRSEDETFANARLIAAAPDLLAALQAYLVGADNGHVSIEVDRAARAAITRATGDA